MLYVVTLDVSVFDANYEAMAEGAEAEFKSWKGRVTITMPFIPFVGMHIGESQMLTVCQVHWLKEEEFIAVLRSIECGRFDIGLQQCKKLDPEMYEGQSPVDRYHADWNAAGRKISEVTHNIRQGHVWSWSEEEEDEDDE